MTKWLISERICRWQISSEANCARIIQHCYQWVWNKIKITADKKAPTDSQWSRVVVQWDLCCLGNLINSEMSQSSQSECKFPYPDKKKCRLISPNIACSGCTTPKIQLCYPRVIAQQKIYLWLFLDYFNHFGLYMGYGWDWYCKILFWKKYKDRRQKISG